MVEKVLLCNSGSEAVYHALRLSRGVTGRKKIIKYQGCFHGFADSACMNVISPAEELGKLHPLSAGSLPEVLAQTVVCEVNNLEQTEAGIPAERSQIAAVILEPVPHNIACVLPQPGLLEGLREMTRRHGAILIFDEVITGFRHGLGGYQNVSGVMPDLTTLGKAMANGYPIAALGAAPT